MATEFVYIKHPDVGTLGGPVTKQALDEIYSKDGWTEANAEEIRNHEYGIVQRQEVAATITEADIDAVRKRADLDQIALDRGVDPTVYDNMQSLAAAVKSTLNTETQE